MAKTHYQMYLSPDLRPHYEHGGSIAIGKRKKARPIVTKQPLHLVFRSEVAKGSLSLFLPQHRRLIEYLKLKLSKKFQIKIYEFANSSNHLHFLVRTQSRENLQNFLRAFAGQTAQKITRAQKGKPFGKRFWTLLVYSRIVFWGKAFQIVKRYIFQNTLETLGVIPYNPRQNRPPP